MTYAAVKFEFARSNGLERDTFMFLVNVSLSKPDAQTDRQTEGQTDSRSDRLWYEIIIPFFSKEKIGFNESLYSFQETLKHFHTISIL